MMKTVLYSAIVGILILSAGCSDSEEPQREVVLYCSVDVPFAKAVVAVFEKESGIRVLLKTDTEAGKTTALVRRLEAESARPQADVFWSSEVFNTIKLAEAGLLSEYRPPAEGIPERYRDPNGRWTAFGLRARVIAYNTEMISAEDAPKMWADLALARWKGKVGVADPRFGTTSGHFAAMHALWGEETFVTFLKSLGETLDYRLLSGNATAAQHVGGGRLTICATDTDDVYARQELGDPIAMIYPDLGDGGTLVVPNSVGLIAGGPHPKEAKVLIDFLTSEITERMLAVSSSRNIPVREDLRKSLSLKLPPETQLAYSTIAASLDRVAELTGEHLIR